MAGADYRSCDICGSKAFYDACLGYDYPDDDHMIRRAGRPFERGRLDDLGDWAVLCDACCETHSTAIVSEKRALAAWHGERAT